LIMKDLNWNKGLFRIWIVLSIIWAIGMIYEAMQTWPYDGKWEGVILFSIIPPLIVLILFVFIKKIIKFIITGFKK